MLTNRLCRLASFLRIGAAGPINGSPGGQLDFTSIFFTGVTFMIPSFLLALREGLEAALIIGIVLGALHKMNRPALKPAVWRGTAAAIGGSFLVALVLNLIGAELEGAGEQIFEGFTMLLAAGVLTWMIFWMKRQSRHLKKELEEKTSQAVGRSGQRALFALAFLAVFREGVELALFLLATRFASSPLQTIIGALLGLAGAVILGWMMFNSSRRLNLQQFFTVTSILLILFAAGLVGHAVHEFNELGWIPAIIDPVYNLNPLLPEQSFVGDILKALFGYNGNPSLTETIAYLGYFGILLVITWPGRYRKPVLATG
uniref:Iron transporter n=1 Tax=Anaerolinea thermolimosa TaxID=229919 RepID=A0A7C4KG29_9CHLR